MSRKDDNFLTRLLATFKVEAREHIQAIAAGLVELEKASTEQSRAETLDAVFRCAHSLKGAARAVNVSEIEALCQSLESVFAALKRQELLPSAELFDLLHQVVDRLGQLLPFAGNESRSSSQPDIGDLVRSLRAVLTQSAPPKAESADASVETPPVSMAEPARSVTDTVRVSTSKLDAVLLQAEELLSAKLAAAQHAAKLRQLQTQSLEWKKRWAALEPELRATRQFLDKNKDRNGVASANSPWKRILEFLEWNHDVTESWEGELADLSRRADQDQRSVSIMVDSLLDEIKKIVMQPFSTLLDVFPRFVRELSREQGKEVELVIRGGDIEIDRRILEEMKDPLIHLVRNCLDHGIEAPAIRMQKGKPPCATITIGISPRNGSNVELLIADDGSGIDPGKAKAAAIKLGLLSSERAETLDDQEALFLIFQPGVSTSPIITDISGRGLGLAIVNEQVEKLRGTLALETEPGKGTVFRIVLPLTLARFRGVVVRAGEDLFVVPTTNVERVVRVRTADIKTVENRDTIVLGGQAISLDRLGGVLGLPRASAAGQPEVQPVVVVSSANQRIAFAVEEVLNEQEVLVKTLGKQLARFPNIAGATVLGSGRVVPILNILSLMKSTVRASASASRTSSAASASVETKKKSVLVAEDSITSRTLLKNILETAGYHVETSVDGIDAFTKLRSGKFDLVVSDVEMPRLNGFDLTAKIRADKKFAELPVVLVTALESREDRERGIDAGASAYIVKSTFDQSNLLEVIHRLI
ncbi:MAG TPA: hybrid sensor histidine kinase/response regulator [Candidatus Angelobacter sp.]|nr:hybrid sensor histidine kinase/response regulator [Candidatus Angelobacter sp.]